MTVAQRKTASFTLVELLAVIAVIATLMAIVLGGALYAKQKSNISRAKAEVAVLGMAMESFKNDYGRYPTSSTSRALMSWAGGSSTGGVMVNPVIINANLLYAQLVGPKKYYTPKASQLIVYTNTTTITFNATTWYYTPFTCILDPWVHPYNYYRTYPIQTDQVNQATFDLWSCGPNGVNENGGGDDISNWRR